MRCFGTIALFLCLGTASCDQTLFGGGMSGNPPSLVGLAGLRVVPDQVTLEIGNANANQPTTQRFEAIGSFDDGHEETVSDRVMWSSNNPRLGSFQDGSTLVAGPFGANGKVTAASGGQSGSALVILHLSRQVVADGAQGATPGQFQGPAPENGQVPALVYPYDRVLMPPNLGSLEIQWQKGSKGNSIFQITLHSTSTLDLVIYTPCVAPSGGTGCAFTLPRDLWNALAYSNLDSAADPVRVTVRGLSPADKTVGESPPLHVAFTAADLFGGIYYWTATGSQSDGSGIFRLDLSSGKVESFFTSQESPPDSRGETRQCVGCHALSHAGDKLSMVLGGGHVSDLLQFDVGQKKATLTRIDTTLGKSNTERQFSNFQSYGPDGTSFVSALRGTLRLLDAKSGAERIARIDTGGTATHPDWSLSGRMLAVTRFLDPLPKPQVTDGDPFELYVSQTEIALLRWNGTTFSTPVTLAPWKTGRSSYYPSVSPDDLFVAYNRVECPAKVEDCSVYNNPRARIFLSPAVAGAKEVELVRMNGKGPTDTTGDLTSSWPRFSPFVQKSGGGSVMWLTFSSKRNYGLRLVDKDRPQLWMAAVTPKGEVLTDDPSAPPFWIPGQDPSTNNHIAQWTEQVVPIIQ